MRHLVRAATPVLLFVMFSSALAQQPDAGSSSQTGNALRSNDEDALLARAAKLYYSTKSAGLTGFDCAVHPDWSKLFQGTESQINTAGSRESVNLLKSVAIRLHARMNGGSTLEWVQPSNASRPLDQASAETVDQMHKAIEETLTGFMQFWTPFVDGSVVPPNAKGIDIRHSPSGLILLLKQPDATVMEVFSNELVLKEFKVITGGRMIDLKPSYDSVDDGLLVSRFVAHIGPEKDSTKEAQEMDAEIYYQTVGN